MLSGQFINATLVVQMWLFSSCNGNFKKFWKRVRVSWLSRKIRLMALYFSQELNKICNLEPFKLFCWLIQYSFCSFSLNVYDRFLIELDFQAMKSLGISLLLPAFQHWARRDHLVWSICVAAFHIRARFLGVTLLGVGWYKHPIC